MKIKRRLTEQQEFEILKLVLDKYLWLGFAIMAFGLFVIYKGDFAGGMTWIISGSIVLIILMMLIIKEYEILG